MLPFFGDVNIPPGEYMDEPTMQLVSQYLDDNHDTLILLHRAAIFPHCRYPIESDNEWYSIAHFNGIRLGSKLLALESLYYTNRNRVDMAVQILLDSFALADSLKDEPLLISSLNHAALVALNISNLTDILAMTPLPKKLLEALENAITQIDYDYLLKRAMIGQYAFIFEYEEMLYDHEREKLGHINNLRECIDLSRLPVSERVRYAKTKVQPDWYIRKNKKDYEMGIQCLWASFAIFASQEATRRLTITALAVEQYRHDHKKLPDSLIKLAPDYLDAVIKDPYDDQNLRYKKLEIGYIVYSIGEDLTDNDGAIENADGYMDMPGTDITFTVRR